MQSTESNIEVRLDLDHVLARVKTWPARLIPEEAADLRAILAALAAERDRAGRWAAQVAAIEEVLDDHAFDDEDGNGFVPIGPLQDALFGKKMPA